MNRTLRPIWLIFAVALGLLLAGVAYCSLHARQDVIAGPGVTQVREYFGLSFMIPIPTGVATEYWVYVDSKGNRLRHGPARSYNPKGILTHEAEYKDGRLDGTERVRNDDGELQYEIFWKEGVRMGGARYINGQLSSAKLTTSEPGIGTVTKVFFQGKWYYEVTCNEQKKLALSYTEGCSN